MSVNTTPRRLYLLAAALLASCTVGESRHETIRREWPASEIRRVELHEVNGSVTVEASTSDKVSLVADVRARNVEAKPNEDNRGYFRSEVDGDTLTIGRRERGHFRFPFFRQNDINIDYTLRVPSTVALEIATVNGRIATKGVNAETELTTVNGAIELETPGAAKVNLHSVNGRLRAKFLQTFQGARMKTVNGSVEAVLPPSASFACDLSQINGDFEASFPLTIHSHPGSRRVSGEVNGGQYELRVVTVNGDIRIEHGDHAAPFPAVPHAPHSVPETPAPPPPPPAPTT